MFSYLEFVNLTKVLVYILKKSLCELENILFKKQWIDPIISLSLAFATISSYELSLTNLPYYPPSERRA